MKFRSGKMRYARVPTPDCRCDHPQIVHYTQGGFCAYTDCTCIAFKAKGRQEFNGTKDKCNYGHAHNSKAETKFCFELHCRKLAGHIKDFKAEQKLDLPGPSGAIVATYKIDFIVKHFNGTTEFVEVKGNQLKDSGQWPLKWKLLMDKHKGDRKYSFRVVEV